MQLSCYVLCIVCKMIQLIIWESKKKKKKTTEDMHKPDIFEALWHVNWNFM